jgi:hypothetical protein
MVSSQIGVGSVRGHVLEYSHKVKVCEYLSMALSFSHAKPRCRKLKCNRLAFDSHRDYITIFSPLAERENDIQPDTGRSRSGKNGWSSKAQHESLCLRSHGTGQGQQLRAFIRNLNKFGGTMDWPQLML